MIEFLINIIFYLSVVIAVIIFLLFIVLINIIATAFIRVIRDEIKDKYEEMYATKDDSRRKCIDKVFDTR